MKARFLATLLCASVRASSDGLVQEWQEQARAIQDVLRPDDQDVSWAFSSIAHEARIASPDLNKLFDEEPRHALQKWQTQVVLFLNPLRRRMSNGTDHVDHIERASALLELCKPVEAGGGEKEAKHWLLLRHLGELTASLLDNDLWRPRNEHASVVQTLLKDLNGSGMNNRNHLSEEEANEAMIMAKDLMSTFFIRWYLDMDEMDYSGSVFVPGFR